MLRIFRFITILLGGLLLLAFNAGADSSTPLQAAFIKAELAPAAKIWPGQRRIFAVTLYTTTSFSGSSRFTLPMVDGLLIMEDEGRPLLNSLELEGTSYVSKRYELSLFPLRSGKYSIPSFWVEFMVKDPAGKTVTKKFTTWPQEFSVLKIPGSVSGQPIIIASDLKVDEKWQPPPGPAKVGDAFSRTITITANDQPGMAIPPLEMAKVKGLAIYNDQSQVNDKMDRGNFIGIRTQKHSYVCEKTGTLLIPKITIQFWNPASETLKKFTLKEVQLQVAANPLLAHSDQGGGASRSASRLSGGILRLMIISLACVLALFLLYHSRKRWQKNSKLLKIRAQFRTFQHILRKHTLPNFNPWEK
jgi:hypothetical protein